ncbi:MAG: hypothetical protein M9890_12875 [Thermomicrobiales bacterium]|nr:hypothetical protein [Thermomicrobiales bacterium]
MPRRDHRVRSVSRRMMAFTGIIAITATLISMLALSVMPEASAATLDSPPISPYVLTATDSAEQQLADKYSPIVYLRQISSNVCDIDNEGFDPVPVDFVLNRDDIPLMESETGEASGARSVVTESPTAADLYGRDAGSYLDYPGTPVRPGCVYRQYFADRDAQENLPRVAYAHIYTEPGTDTLALQYWMYYYFNDWNNNHEGDWEMVMFFFDTTSVEEALTMEPSSLIYAQHGGGERASWDDGKLSKEDGHPVVYVARGAHASFFEQHVYLGLAENGTGFGCETTQGPHRRYALQAIVVPHEPEDANDQFAWLAFDGRWGELRRSEWNGPTGPNDKRSWTEPVTWANAQRDSSLIVPDFEGFGQAPLNIFCGAVSGGSRVLVAFSRTPALVGGILGVVLLVVGGVFAYASSTIGRAFSYYRRNLRTFALIGAALIPIGYLVAAIQTLLFQVPPIGPFVDMMGRFPGIRILVLITIGGLQALAAVIFVEPTVIWMMTQLRRGSSPRVSLAYRNGVRAIVPIILARLHVLLTALKLAITIIGIPKAIMVVIRSVFIPQAVIIDRESPDSAIVDSAAAVNKSVSRTLLTQISLFLITTLVGPLAAIFFLLAVPSRPVDLVNFLSSLFFAFLYPLGVIGMTHLYAEHRTGASWEPEADMQGAPATSEA